MQDIFGNRILKYTDDNIKVIRSLVSTSQFGEYANTETSGSLTDTTPDYILTKVISEGEVLESFTDLPYQVVEGEIQVDLATHLRNKGYSTGMFDIEMSFHRNVVGSNLDETEVGTNDNKLFVKEISQKRLELRLNPVAYSELIFDEQIAFGDYDPVTSTANTVSNPAQPEEGAGQESVEGTPLTQTIDFELNIGGYVLPIINKVLDYIANPISPYDLLIKLEDKLPAEIKKNEVCWVSRTLAEKFTTSIILESTAESSEPYNQLGPANFTVRTGTVRGSSTGFESFDDLLGAEDEQKTRIINEYLSGSLQGIDLAIDHRKYENFIQFSSAEERLRSFVHKLQQIEYYDTKIAAVSTDYQTITAFTASTDVTGSDFFLSNKAKWTNKRNEILGTFDHYDRYLYYESSSYESSSFGEFTPATWPKDNSTKPYTLAPSTSSAALEWLGNIHSSDGEGKGQLHSASLFDNENPAALRSTIPQYLINDPANDSYKLFVDMAGQHYDILLNYIKGLGKLHDRDEGLTTGLSKDTISELLSSYGWNPQLGFNVDALWKYVLGTDNSGSYQATEPDGTSVIFNQSESLPRDEISKEILNRLLNNLPYIYKTKGTERSIRALTNCYGIPDTILDINEYGGPSRDKTVNVKHKRKKFSYALQFDGDDSQISVPWHPVTGSDGFSGWPVHQEIRINCSGSSVKRNQSILATSMSSDTGFRTLDTFSTSSAGWNLWMEHTGSYSASSDYGRLHFYITGSNETGDSAATASFTFDTAAQGGKITFTSLKADAATSRTKTYIAMTSSVVNGSVASGKVQFSASATLGEMANNFAAAVTHSNGHGNRISTTVAGAKVTLTQAFSGSAGNFPISQSDNFNGIVAGNVPAAFVAGKDLPGRMLSASTDWIPLYNGDWWNIGLNTTTGIETHTTRSGAPNVSFQITAKLAADHADGKVTHSGSAEISLTHITSQSYLRAWTYNKSIATNNESAVFIGGVNDSEWVSHGILNKFSGSMQEYSQYTERLEDDILDIHTLAPSAIVGNHYTSSYDTLIRRFPMGTDLNNLNHNTFTIISSSHPQQSNTTYVGLGSSVFTSHGSASGFTDTDNYETVDEYYFTTMPDIIGERPISHKIRIEDNTLTSQSLQPIFTGISVETSSFDTHPVDSNRLSIGLSPSQNINLDIAYQFGNLSFDDFVGDPRDEWKSEYTTLSTVQDAYFKKFSGAYNVGAFSRLLKFFDKSLWQQIENLVPARANTFVGLIIEPTILERSKVKRTKPSFEHLYYTASVSVSCIHTATVPSTTTVTNSGSLSTAAFSSLDDNIDMFVNDSGHSYKTQGSIYKYGVNTGSGAYETTQSVEMYGVLTSVTSSRVSETWQDLDKFFYHPSSSGQDRHIEAAYSAAADNFYSSSRKFAEVQDYRPRQIKNLYYEGVKIFSELVGHATSSGTGSVYLTFPSHVASGSRYAESTQVPDGQPVIEIFTVNPNTVVVGGTPGQVSQVPSAVNNLNLANLTMAPPSITLATGKGGIAGVTAAVKGATSAVANTVSVVSVAPAPPSPYVPIATPVKTAGSSTSTSAKSSTSTVSTAAKSSTPSAPVSYAKGKS
mgnify:CR=1 FL=1|tara:strand:+ start:8982 stop:13736 length:4755 start_codon:yes stop_codon:yes gene_type:complete